MSQTGVLIIEIKYKDPTFLTEKQREIYDCKSRYVLCCAANKTGKSLLLACLINKHALLGEPGTRYCWLAPFFRTARIGYDLVEKIIKSTKIYTYLEETNNYRKFRFNASKLEITYPSGNVIDFIQGSNVEGLFGYKYNFVAIDEATRLKQEEVIMGDRSEIICPSFKAIMTTVKTTQAQIFCIFNPTTKRNTFWKWYIKAKNGLDERTSAFHLSTMDSVNAGFVSLEDYNYAKEKEIPYIFKRDWLGELPDEYNSIFRADKVYDCVDDDIKEDISKVDFFGIDLGFSTNSSADWTVVTGLNKKGQVVFFKRFKAEGEELINKLKSYINNRLAYIDASGGGLTVYDLLKIYCKNLKPYKFNNSSKQILIETLVHYIHTKKITYRNNDILINELCAYEAEVSATGITTFSNGKGAANDDSVIALALAVLKYKEKEDSGDSYTFNIYDIEENKEYNREDEDERMWQSMEFNYNLQD